MPPPAPWLSSRVAIGLCATADVTSRASPCGVAMVRIVGLDHDAATSSSGSGSTSSGPLLRTLPTSGGHRDTPRAARARPGPAGRAARPLDARVEPGSPAVALDHQRHPVVDVAQRRPRPAVVSTVQVQRNRSGSSSVAGRVPPDLVEPGHRQHAAVGGPDEERLLRGLPALRRLRGGVPLEVAVGGQQAAAHGERPLVRRLLGDRLHARVDHPVADATGPWPRTAPGPT